jgi:HEAT repeat protein
MKIALVCLFPVLLVAADRLPAQPAADCVEMREKSDPETLKALSRALDDPGLLSCAAEDLRIAGAIEPLKQALSSPNFQVRAAAARELGSFQSPDLLEPLSRAAQDENLLVATNALSGLSQYRDPAVIPYLRAIAQKGGMVGDMALDRLLQIDAVEAVRIARALLASKQVPDQLYAMRILGAAGDRSDLPQLRKVATAPEETLSQRDRGFGFMPAVNLARAAHAAIAAIEARGP